METAIHVAEASNLIGSHGNGCAIFQNKNANEFTEALTAAENNNQITTLAIDGPTVSIMQSDSNLEKRFFAHAG